jgi:hypothetical protein
MLAASFTLIFLYGSLIYGLFPEFGKLIGKNISWEGHLSGAITGVIFGTLYRNKGPQKPPPLDDDFDDFEDEYWNSIEIDEEAHDTYIQYTYKEKD